MATDRAPADEALTFVRLARARDTLTLLMLARSAPPAVVRRLLTRAAELVPPPAGASIEAMVGGDSGPFWQWFDALDLPPPKHWWLNWRDGVGAFARGFRGF